MPRRTTSNLFSDRHDVVTPPIGIWLTFGIGERAPANLWVPSAGFEPATHGLGMRSWSSRCVHVFAFPQLSGMITSAEVRVCAPQIVPYGHAAGTVILFCHRVSRPRPAGLGDIAHVNGPGAALEAHPAVGGCYEAARAAALSGVPISTVYYRANRDVVTPSASPVRTRLWSYGDLMALRMVSWSRHPKAVDDGLLPASPMPGGTPRSQPARRAGSRPVAAERRPTRTVPVDRAGHVFVWAGDDLLDSTGGPTLKYPVDGLELLAPYIGAGQRGPDLLRPRPHLRIVPSKVSGEPHIAGSRLTTPTIAALGERGLSGPGHKGPVLYTGGVTAVPSARRHYAGNMLGTATRQTCALVSTEPLVAHLGDPERYAAAKAEEPYANVAFDRYLGSEFQLVARRAAAVRRSRLHARRLFMVHARANADVRRSERGPAAIDH